MWSVRKRSRRKVLNQTKAFDIKQPTLTMSLSRRGFVVLSNTGKCLGEPTLSSSSRLPVRCLSSTTRSFEPETQSTESTEQSVLDPQTVYTHKQERLLWKNQRRRPIGSRRKRVAMATGAGLAFEQLPYQCFQDARKILADDRNELLDKIKAQSERIDKLKEQQGQSQEVDSNSRVLRSLAKHVEQLTLEADGRDPVILKTFEDGKGKHSQDSVWPC
jgi:large subunit ribosomal protein L35